MSAAEAAEASAQRVAAARELAAAARRIHARGWAEATSGNFSVSLGRAPRRILITASGCDKASLAPDDTVLVDGEGAPLAGEARRPSYETLIHARVYEALDAGAVLHAHPEHVVALSLVVEAEIALRGLELVKAFAGVQDPDVPLALPVVENDQDMVRMSRACVAARRPSVPAVVLRGHGVTVWGATLAEAIRHLEAVEALARIIVLRRSMGTER